MRCFSMTDAGFRRAQSGAVAHTPAHLTADYAIITLDPAGHVLSWDAGAQRITGHDASEMTGRHVSLLYPPEAGSGGGPARDLAAAVTHGHIEHQGWRVRKDGTRFWANMVITPLFDAAGKLSGFANVIRDVSRTHNAELALRESEERFRLLVQSVVDYAIFMLDPGGHIASWNAGAQRIKGYTKDDILGQHFSVFYPPEDIATDKPGRELETAIAQGRFEDEGWRVRKDGTRFWANVVITALFDTEGKLRGFGKVTRDLTERRSTERALDDRGRLLAHLVKAQERERRRIAWDVHDDSIQSMVAVGMRLQLLAGKLPAEHAESVRQLNEAVSASIGRLRNLTFRLRPPGLEREGLGPALTNYLAQVAGNDDLVYTLQNNMDAEPPAETTLTIFRICQEALTNVRKHAQATSATVSLTSTDGGVLVRVTDDGTGLDPEIDQLAHNEHFGLIEMRERTEAAGGWWHLRTRPGAGTTVEFWVPAVHTESAFQL